VEIQQGSSLVLRQSIEELILIVVVVGVVGRKIGRGTLAHRALLGGASAGYGGIAIGQSLGCFAVGFLHAGQGSLASGLGGPSSLCIALGLGVVSRLGITRGLGEHVAVHLEEQGSRVQMQRRAARRSAPGRRAGAAPRAR